MPNGKPSPERRRCRAEGPDPLRTGRLGLATTLVLYVVCAATILTVLLLPDFDEPLQRQRSLVSVLALSNLSVVPSGRALRHPEILNPAVPIRYTPWLDYEELEPASLWIGLIPKTVPPPVREDGP